MNRAVNLEDLRRMARRRLPRPIYDLVAGGADDEITLAANQREFDEYRLAARAFSRGEGRPDTGVTLLGRRLGWPVMLAPTGAARVLHRDAELAVARAARSRETGYVHGVVSGHPLAQIAAVEPGPLWLQLYLTGDRDQLSAVIQDARDCDIHALVVTVDLPVIGNRERDRRHGLTVPMRPTAKTVAQCVAHPRWGFDFLRGNLPQSSPLDGRSSPFATQREILRSAHPVRLEDLEFIRASWDGPLLVKGILHAEDCRIAVAAGADGVIVSNHGGRQLDRAPATLAALPEVVRAADEGTVVLLDGGVRRGTDVLIALASGADAVLIGRPYLYGLAAGGQSGVERAIDILRMELERAMRLMGLATIGEVGPGCLIPR